MHVLLEWPFHNGFTAILRGGFELERPESLEINPSFPCVLVYVWGMLCISMRVRCDYIVVWAHLC